MPLGAGYAWVSVAASSASLAHVIYLMIAFISASRARAASMAVFLP
jgi:hypothetical protein